MEQRSETSVSLIEVDCRYVQNHGHAINVKTTGKANASAGDPKRPRQLFEPLSRHKAKIVVAATFGTTSNGEQCHFLAR